LKVVVPVEEMVRKLSMSELNMEKQFQGTYITLTV